MGALVTLRRCVSDRILRTRDAEKEARSTSDAKLVALSAKHAALVRTARTQQEKIDRLEGDASALVESEKRLREHIATLEARAEADREATAKLRMQLAEASAQEATSQEQSAAVGELAVEKSKTAELEERLRRTDEEHARMVTESEANRAELTRLRDAQAAAETAAKGLKDALGIEEGKAMAAAADVEVLQGRLSALEEEMAGMEESGGKADELAQQVLALKAQHELLESRSRQLQEAVDSKTVEIEGMREDLEKAKALERKLADAEEEFHVAVDVLTEERDAARQKEVEYFEELTSTANDLADIQSGYVDLSDRLNDKTDQIFEVQEQLEEERDKVAQLQAQLVEAQKGQLKLQKELVTLNAQAAQDKDAAAAAAAVAAAPMPAQAPSASPAEPPPADGGDGGVNTSSGNNSAEEIRQRDALIASLQQQVAELRDQAALAPAENVLVAAAGSNAAESSRQLEEAVTTIEELRDELTEAASSEKGLRSQLEQALRERDLAVDETNREADRRVQRAIADARKAQSELSEYRERVREMEDKVAAAVKAQKIAEQAFSSVAAAEVGDEDEDMGRYASEEAYGSGARAVRAINKGMSSYGGAEDNLDDSYGADAFSEDDYDDGFD